MAYARLISLTGVVLTATGCSTDPLVCTGEFVLIPAIVVNQTAQTLHDLSVRATVRRSEAVLDITAEHPSPSVPADGLVELVIFSDAFKDEIQSAGEAVTVVVTTGDLSAGALYQFGTDGCHVQKLAGPDTLFMA